MRKLIVDEKNNNKKLIEYLLANFDGLATSTIYKTLRKKDIKINGKRISENCTLYSGDELQIYISDDLLEKQYEIPIVYQDENIVVFEKPQGIEVTGTKKSVTSYAKKLFASSNNTFVEPCHRLDRNTSGLVLFARSNKALEIILDLFKNHKIEKHYICVVYGIPNPKSKKLESYLFKDSKKSLVYISDEKKQGYQKIITSYTTLKCNYEKNIALLDVKLETGKTHQIRAHLSHIGYPIIGDGKYGTNKINKLFKAKSQLLSSYSLSFNVPQTSILSYLNNITIKQRAIPFINLL